MSLTARDVTKELHE